MNSQFNTLGLVASRLITAGIIAVFLVNVFWPDQISAQKTSGTADSELARLPFQRHMNLVIVKVRINGSEPLNLLIDSGASSSMVLESAVADRLELKMNAPQKGGKTSQGGQFTMRFAPRVSVELGSHSEELTNVLVAACQGHAQTMLGIEVHGILGHEFLSRITLEVDYEAKELVMHDPKKYKYKGSGAILDIEFDPKLSNLPFTTAEFESSDGTRHKVRMLVDSGGSTMATCGLVSTRIFRRTSLPTRRGYPRWVSADWPTHPKRRCIHHS